MPHANELDSGACGGLAEQAGGIPGKRQMLPGGWVVPPDKLAAGDWAGIEALAREGASLAMS
jgi:hypothetical protein